MSGLAETCDEYLVLTDYTILQIMPSRVYKAEVRQCQISIVNVLNINSNVMLQIKMATPLCFNVSLLSRTQSLYKLRSKTAYWN
jgi:hypothetical protein